MNRAAIPLALLAALGLLAGCAGTRQAVMTKAKTIHTVEVTTTTVAVTAGDGSVTMVPVTTRRELWQDEDEHTQEDEKSTSGPDGRRIIEAAAQGAQVVAGSSGIGAPQVIGGLLALATATATAWGAKKASEANAERKRADEHKSDADAGWKKADRYARQLPPERGA